MTLLSLLDISSYVFLTFYVVDNMFRSFAYTFDLPLQNPIDRGLTILGVFETLLTPLTVICLFIVVSIGQAVYGMVLNTVKKYEWKSHRKGGIIVNESKWRAGLKAKIAAVEHWVIK